MAKNVLMCDECKKQMEKIEFTLMEQATQKELDFCNKRCLSNWANKTGGGLFGG